MLLSLAIVRWGLPEGAPQRDPEPGRGSGASEAPATVVLRGRVVLLGEYLKERYGTAVDREQAERETLLVTDHGLAIPLLRDSRSRGFFLDKRWRNRPIELTVRRFAGLPYVQLIDAWALREGKRFHLRYWCSTCAITTYEPGPCPCCQEEVELQEVPE
jgi:hypothetical protein